MKRLDWLVLKSFIPPFILTYAVVVFLLLIQTMLAYVDEFVGKDVGWLVYGKMMFYFSLSLTPMALPLAVLLSALMTFGNLGEHFELTAIKSAGISLVRILIPIGIFSAILCVVAFWFNNTVQPYANLKAYSTLYNIRKTKAALDLKEGAFYDGIPNYSIKVSKKYPDGKTLKDLIIYNHSDYRGNKEVILADSGQMYTILDNQYLVMELFRGNSYSEQKDDQGKRTKFVRNEYNRGKLVFSLSAFNKLEIPDSLFKQNRIMKSVEELSTDRDSLQRELSKTYLNRYSDISSYYIYHTKNVLLPTDTLPGIKWSKSSYQNIKLPEKFIDSLYEKPFNKANTQIVLQRAVSQARNVKSYLDFKSSQESKLIEDVRAYEIEMYKKFSYALACFMMFLIGAPLGSIIKKGGLGVPILVSILFFIVYYTLSLAGEKWVKDNVLPAYIGMWISNAVLFLFGLFFLSKSRNDSRMFEGIDIYFKNILSFFKGLKLQLFKLKPQVSSR